MHAAGEPEWEAAPVPLLDRDGVRIRCDRTGKGPVVPLPPRHHRVVAPLPTIDVPTLVVVGTVDEPFLAAAGHMAAETPGPETVAVDGAGHASSIDHPDVVDQAVTGPLASLRR